MKFLLVQLISVSRPSLVLPKFHHYLLLADFSHSGVKATAAICLYLEICAKEEDNLTDTPVSNPPNFLAKKEKPPYKGGSSDGSTT